MQTISAEAVAGFFTKNPAYMGEIARMQSLFRCFKNQGGICVSMTEEQRSQCQTIIHSHAATAAAGNAVPVPGLGFATDTVTMTTMAMALSGVFGSCIEKNVARNLAITALKKQVLKTPIKSIAKELGKFIPFAGQVVAAGVSAAMLESAGWSMAEELAREANKS